MDISGLKQYYSLHSSRKFICGFSLLMQKASFNRKSTGSVSLAIMFTLIAVHVLLSRIARCLNTDYTGLERCSLILSCTFLIVLPI